MQLTSAPAANNAHAADSPGGHRVRRGSAADLTNVIDSQCRHSLLRRISGTLRPLPDGGRRRPENRRQLAREGRRDPPAVPANRRPRPQRAADCRRTTIRYPVPLRIASLPKDADQLRPHTAAANSDWLIDPNEWYAPDKRDAGKSQSVADPTNVKPALASPPRNRNPDQHSHHAVASRRKTEAHSDVAETHPLRRTANSHHPVRPAATPDARADATSSNATHITAHDKCPAASRQRNRSRRTSNFRPGLHPPTSSRRHLRPLPQHRRTRRHRTVHPPPPRAPPPASTRTSSCSPKTPTPRPASVPPCHEDIYHEWSISAHAYAAVSPMFHKFEQKLNDLSQGTVGYFCMRCHAPVATALVRVARRAVVEHARGGPRRHHLRRLPPRAVHVRQIERRAAHRAGRHLRARLRRHRRRRRRRSRSAARTSSKSKRRPTRKAPARTCTPPASTSSRSPRASSARRATRWPCTRASSSKWCGSSTARRRRARRASSARTATWAACPACRSATTAARSPRSPTKR